MDVKQRLREIHQRGSVVLVVGLGMSGVSIAKLLIKSGFEVLAVDRCSGKERSSEIDGLIELGVRVCFEIDGEDVVPLLDRVELAILSPGVSLESAIVGSLRRSGIDSIGELELAVVLLGGKSVVVTGSNGKTTTVHLIQEFLVRSGINSRLCGNVGIPAASLIKDGKIWENDSESVVVVESSSYQLEGCTVLHPNVAVWLNLSENHLERHGSMERYLSAKTRLFLNQDENDVAILNRDERWYDRISRTVRAKKVDFTQRAPTSNTVNLTVDHAYINYNCGFKLDQIEISWRGVNEGYDISQSRLLGLHNRYNLAAAILAARAIGADREAIQEVINQFLPLEHRIEWLGEFNRIGYINDSKSTTVAAGVAALQTVREKFPESDIVLLVGGLVKAGSWRPLLDQLKGGIKYPVVCFGKDSRLLNNHFSSAGIESLSASCVQEAFELACRIAGPGSIVLFSPCAASFDEFTCFEERGQHFKKLVASFVASGHAQLSSRENQSVDRSVLE